MRRKHILKNIRQVFNAKKLQVVLISILLMFVMFSSMPIVLADLLESNESPAEGNVYLIYEETVQVCAQTFEFTGDDDIQVTAIELDFHTLWTENGDIWVGIDEKAGMSPLHENWLIDQGRPADDLDGWESYEDIDIVLSPNVEYAIMVKPVGTDSECGVRYSIGGYSSGYIMTRLLQFSTILDGKLCFQLF